MASADHNLGNFSPQNWSTDIIFGDNVGFRMISMIIFEQNGNSTPGPADHARTISYEISYFDIIKNFTNNEFGQNTIDLGT